MQLDSRIFVAGHRGLVGSAIVRELQARGYTQIITRSRDELDLRDMAAVEKFFATNRPEYVVLAAAKVGGIYANNTYRADFLYENLAIQNAVIYNAYKHGVKKLLFLGSSCIYPKFAPQPILESALLTSELEYTNEPYAIAKIAGIKLCESFSLQYGCNFVSAMPTNLYGEQDNFDLETSHVFPALLRKMHLAKLLRVGDMDSVIADITKRKPKNPALQALSPEKLLEHYGISKDSVQVWGSGQVRREFLYAQDMAQACVFMLQNIDFAHLVDSSLESTFHTTPQQSPQVRNTHINIGYGSDVSIQELAESIREIVGFSGGLVFDTSKPDGTPRKLMDSSKIHALGWKPSVSLEEGIARVYRHYTSDFKAFYTTIAPTIST